MNVICLHDEAFYKLIEEVLEKFQPGAGAYQDKWVDNDEAMRILKIKSKTTLQQLRDEGKVRFSQPQKRIILYDRQSLEEYIESHAKNTF